MGRARRPTPWSDAAPVITLILVLPGCDGCRRRSAPLRQLPASVPPATPPPGPAVTALPPGPPPPLPQVPPLPPATPVGPSTPCVATLSDDVHLRPSATDTAEGPEVPAGTEVELLERAERYRRSTEMFRVRVRPAGPTGYVFVSPRELGAGCPVAWPQTVEPWRELPPSEFELFYVRRGVFPVRDRVFAAAVEPSGVRTVRTLVADGDGVEDELVTIEVEGRADRSGLALVRHTPRGWRADFVAEDGSSEHHGARWEAPFTAAGGVYLVSVGVESFEQDQEPVRQEHYDLMRVHPDGSLRTVWTGSTWNNSRETWAFTDAGGDRVRLTASTARLTGTTQRSQTLRWDATAFRLVPE